MDTQYITLTLNGESPYRPLRMRRGDTGRKVAASVIDSSGAVYGLAGKYLVFQAKKPDGKKVSLDDNITVDGDNAVIAISQNTIAVAGDVVCELLVFDGKDDTAPMVGTVTWRIQVWQAAVSPEDVESTDEMKTLLGYIEDAKKYAEESQKQAEEARKQAQEAQKQAQEAQSIKDSTEIQYVVDGTRVGFKRADENEYSFTDDLKSEVPGPAGSGSGDMVAEVYDPQGKRTDVFGYVDKAVLASSTSLYFSTQADMNAQLLAQSDNSTGTFCTNGTTAGILTNGAISTEILKGVWYKNSNTLVALWYQYGTASRDGASRYNPTDGLYLSSSFSDERYLNTTGGTQTVAGSKTFSSPVTVPTPTADGHTVNKGYADEIKETFERFFKDVVTTNFAIANKSVVGTDGAHLVVGLQRYKGLGSRTTGQLYFSAGSAVKPSTGTLSVTFKAPDNDKEAVRGYQAFGGYVTKSLLKTDGFVYSTDGKIGITSFTITNNVDNTVTFTVGYSIQSDATVSSHVDLYFDYRNAWDFYKWQKEY